jgi:hypothetical protein
MADPKAKADVRDRFSENIDKIAESGANADQALKNLEQREQHMLELNDWDGDVFNHKDMGSPFSRAEHEKDMRDTISDAESPGVAGDLMLTVLQGDFLGTQERAFRLRHQTKLRAEAHSAARRYGHGHDAGLFKQGIMMYMRALAKVSRDI